MSEHKQPNSSSERPGEGTPGEADQAGGAPLGDTTATQKSGTREETIAELKAEFSSFQPAEFSRDVEDNDEEWQRTGGTPKE